MNIPNKEFLKKNWTGEPLVLAEKIMHPKQPNPYRIYYIWNYEIKETDIDRKVFEFARYLMDCEREWNPAPPFKPNPGWIVN